MSLAAADRLTGEGNERFQHGDFAGAAERYERAAGYFPAHHLAWKGLGHALLCLARPTEAARAFDRAIGLKADSATALWGGALAHAAWNLVAKRASLSGLGFVWLTSLGAFLVTTPFAAWRWSENPPRPGPLLVGILAMFGVPGEGIALILGVDRPLDMLRTVTNVTGDATVATIVAASEGQLAPPEATREMATVRMTRTE